MATDTLTIIVSAIGSVLTLGASLFAAGAWMIRRIDDRIDTVETKLGTRIDTVETKLGTRIDSVESKIGTRIDSVEEKLGARIDAVAADVTDLKIAVARLEGPPRRLLVSGG
ncbi:hypothetical protein [Microbacterium sp. BLY]|uniref:hypothetical protein n=1 Tax=Microbacterium sp. BLY TaxID=2823280 RepID=UPI001B3248AC|nr:hypothetical protein [Microbacterium sp. BLY]MBP3976619.1 hypothetical protein [Microbacterium sp. BLY]